MNANLARDSIGKALMVVVFAAVIGLSGAIDRASAQQAGPRKEAQTVALPGELFVARPPANAMSVKAARQAAQQGKPIVMHGRIGGMAMPFAANRAIFLLSDLQLPPCRPGCGCPTPWDYCCEPRPMVAANLATIQVTDRNGMPLPIDLRGLNGLAPMAEVVVMGTVARHDPNMLLVNAHQIHVKPAGL